MHTFTKYSLVSIVYNNKTGVHIGHIAVTNKCQSQWLFSQTRGSCVRIPLEFGFTINM